MSVVVPKELATTSFYYPQIAGSKAQKLFPLTPDILRGNVLSVKEGAGTTAVAPLEQSSVTADSQTILLRWRWKWKCKRQTEFSTRDFGYF